MFYCPRSKEKREFLLDEKQQRHEIKNVKMINKVILSRLE